MYIAVIGDIVRSGKILDRAEAESNLEQILDEINEIHKDQLASHFSVTPGDEFQGLLKGPDQLLRILFTIKYRLHPIEVRFGVGVGEIMTEIDPERNIGIDGPAFHAARNMVNAVKREESGKKALSTDIMMGSSGADECLAALNSGFTLMHLMEKGWTDKQRENIRDSLLEGLNQSEIAEKRGLYQSTIHRSLVSAGYYEYEQAFRDFQHLISRRWKELS